MNGDDGYGEAEEVVEVEGDENENDVDDVVDGYQGYGIDHYGENLMLNEIDTLVLSDEDEDEDGSETGDEIDGFEDDVEDDDGNDVGDDVEVVVVLMFEARSHNGDEDEVDDVRASHQAYRVAYDQTKVYQIMNSMSLWELNLS